MAVTLRSVAQRAGVSEAAASCVLNGRFTSTRVSEVTKERVLAAARELNYRPNALARALARQRTEAIYLVPPDAWSFPNLTRFSSEMLKGISTAALKTNYDLMLRLNPKEDVDQEVAAITNGRVDGALLSRHRADPLVEHLVRSGFPIVLLYCRSDNPNVWFVDCDNVQGGRLATEYLLSLGHRRILHLTSASENGDSEDRLEGYRQALLAHCLHPVDEWIIPVTWASWNAEEVAQVNAILHAPDRPTAVFAWSDYPALHLMQLAHSWGLRIPQDLSIIGFDSTNDCDHSEPPLTSIRQPIREMAAEGLNLLIQQIEGEQPSQTQLLFAPILDIRASCTPIVG
ncbi:MAG TPA: LacI family DNA-binding transcriptional regulator [Chthonomonadaceae bacterium]|nr:LacI family DNA-binding transcriptional regulator [Chthonomonadaceae bacterium]